MNICLTVSYDRDDVPVTFSNLLKDYGSKLCSPLDFYYAELLYDYSDEKLSSIPCEHCHLQVNVHEWNWHKVQQLVISLLFSIY